jgi:hypothetical protein
MPQDEVPEQGLPFLERAESVSTPRAARLEVWAPLPDWHEARLNQLGPLEKAGHLLTVPGKALGGLH